MTSVALLKLQSEHAWGSLLEAIEGVAQGLAWAVLPNQGPDYLHSSASIQGIALHVATAKLIYGSVGFRNSEVRWRDCADRVEAFEPDWDAAQAYLKEAHAYWTASWEGLRDADLSQEVPHFRGRMWPAWRVIQTVIHHDGYHAGQIAVLRYAVGESPYPPPSEAEDIRTHCAELPSW